jgi:hypothetical protein
MADARLVRRKVLRRDLTERPAMAASGDEAIASITEIETTALGSI